MNLLKSVIKKIISCFPVKNSIVFESRPDFSDNTFMVFKTMIQRKLNNEIKMVYLCYDHTEPPYEFQNIRNVIFLSVEKHKFLAKYYCYFSKVTICCNRFIGSFNKKQLSFYLMHGSPIKDTRSFYRCPNYINWMIAASDGMLDLSIKMMCCEQTKCIGLGYPRNDDFFGKKFDLRPLVGNYKKIIAWYPTVRNYSNGFSITKPKTISFIDDYESAKKLNSFLLENNILLIIKTHFAQKDNFQLNEEMTNIKIISNDFFTTNRISSYTFLHSVDALLTDYSSVYYDYLLSNKPIGFVWDDIDLFKKDLGVIDGFDEYTKGGEKIFNLDELISFVSRVNHDIDLLKETRNEICRLVNLDNDGMNSKRVCDFILEQANINNNN